MFNRVTPYLIQLWFRAAFEADQPLLILITVTSQTNLMVSQVFLAISGLLQVT